MAQTVSQAHSAIGASAMPRLIRCPASFRLAAQLPAHATRRSTIWAATGTVAHALAEDAITQGYDPAAQLDEIVTVDGHDVTVDADMIAAVRVYADEVQHRSQGATLARLETRVVLDPYWPRNHPPPVSAFGTADFWAYHGATRHLDVLDYKNGAGVFVDVTDNPQLLYYAAGVLLELDTLTLSPPVTIDLTVVQPNVPGRDKVRTHRTTTLDVIMWVQDTLIPTITEASQPGARIAVGAHCRFCPVGSAGACPAKHAIAQDLARREFGPIVPGQDAPIEYTPELLAKIMDDFLLIEDHMKAVRDLAQENITNGVPVPGWSLVPTRPTRSWDGVDLSDIQSELAAEGAGGNILASISTKPTLRSPAQVEKLLAPELWEIIAPHVQSKSSGVKLVPDTSAGNSSTRATPRDDFA